VTTAIQKLTQAEKWLSEAKTLDDLQQIHDIAVAAEAYAKAHRLGIAAENHAMEVRLLAGRRIGELVPATPARVKGRRAHGKELSEVRTTDLPEKQRLSEFRKLAQIPLPQFKERIEHLKEQSEKLNYKKMVTTDWYQSSETPEWPTPQWLFDLLDREFHFTLDVCATKDNAKCVHFYTRQDNGLEQQWSGKCWMNPPYGREIAEWMTKAKESAKAGATVVCLVPARPDTDWWWENALAGEIRFIRGRLKWPGSNTMAPFPSAVVVLGNHVKPRKVVWWEVSQTS